MYSRSKKKQQNKPKEGMIKDKTQKVMNNQKIQVVSECESSFFGGKNIKL